MAKGAANEKALGELHTAITSIFKRILSGYETKLSMFEQMATDASSDLGEELVSELMAMSFEPSPAMLSAVTKFLKDNEVTYDSEQLDELGDLEKRLADKKRNRPNFNNVTELPLTGTHS
jgi:hypothetical protein